MIITYHGIEFFKAQYGETTIAFNPVSKDSKFKASRFGADIVLSSLNHADMNGVEQVAFGDKNPFVISGPGEYEVRDIFIKGLPSESGYEGVPTINTIYSLTLDNMHICFVGALASSELPGETSESLADIDILFVPIGGEGVMDPAEAYKLVVALEPKLVIPMHYGDVGKKDALKLFLKEAGAEGTSPVEKLTIKRKDLEGKEAEVVVLKSI